MQCKDIPDGPILEFLFRHKGEWCNWILGNRNVAAAMPAGIPPKLVLAKMRKLIKRGWVSGCGCGCRGDFDITTEGEHALEDYLSQSKPKTSQEATTNAL